jgi:hypothetical protein
LLPSQARATAGLPTHPAPIPHRLEKGLFAGIFTASRRDPAATIPHHFHTEGPKRPKMSKPHIRPTRAVFPQLPMAAILPRMAPLRVEEHTRELV